VGVLLAFCDSIMGGVVLGVWGGWGGGGCGGGRNTPSMDQGLFMIRASRSH